VRTIATVRAGFAVTRPAELADELEVLVEW